MSHLPAGSSDPNHSRYTSIKTRIETFNPSRSDPLVLSTLATLPSKQGLKHTKNLANDLQRLTLATLPSKQGLKHGSVARVLRLALLDSRYTSIKTRIETLWRWAGS